MRTTAPGIGGEQQQGSTKPPDTDSFTQTVPAGQQYCYHLKVVHYLAPDGYSSQICRFGQPGVPAAPTGVSVAAGANNYSAILNWTQSDTLHTHEFVIVERSGTPGHIARYYLPYSGTGAKSKTITLGVNDSLPGTYYFYVATCNAKYNAYNPGVGLSCTSSGAVTRYLSP